MTTEIQVINKAVIQRKGEGQITITFEDVRKRICPTANDSEIILFLNRCQNEQLDPFRNEIYLVKYGNDPAATIIAIESYLKVAESRDNYKGYSAGIILKKKDQAPEFREGEVIFEDERESLAGGWARVYLSDKPRPVYVSVNLREYQKFTKEGKLTRFWFTAPAAQIRKVALAHALKEAFPSRFAGTVVEGEFNEVDEDTITEAFKTGDEENWKLFWAKQKEKGLNYKSCLAILGINKMHEDWLNLGKTLEQADDAINAWLNKDKGETKPPVVIEAATKPDGAPGMQAEPAKSESDILFDQMGVEPVKETPKIDIAWVLSTIKSLSERGNTEVTPEKLRERFRNVYHLALPITGVKFALSQMAKEHVEDFCKWLADQESKTKL